LGRFRLGCITQHLFDDRKEFSGSNGHGGKAIHSGGETFLPISQAMSKLSYSIGFFAAPFGYNRRKSQSCYHQPMKRTIESRNVVSGIPHNRGIPENIPRLVRTECPLWGPTIEVKVSRSSPLRRAWKLAASAGALPAQSRRPALAILARPTHVRETQFPPEPRSEHLPSV
jgi:hypothetical protein